MIDKTKATKYEVVHFVDAEAQTVGAALQSLGRAVSQWPPSFRCNIEFSHVGGLNKIEVWSTT